MSAILKTAIIKRYVIHFRTTRQNCVIHANTSSTVRSCTNPLTSGLKKDHFRFTPEDLSEMSAEKSFSAGRPLRDERGKIIFGRKTSARCQISCASLGNKCFIFSRKTSARCKPWVYCAQNCDQSEIDRKFLIGAKNSGEAGLSNKPKFSGLVQVLSALAQFQNDVICSQK